MWAANKRSWRVAAAAILVVGALGAVGDAQQGPGGGPWGEADRPRGRGMGPMGPMRHFGLALGQLDLTDAQRDQVRTVLQNHRDQMQQLAKQAGAARLALRQATEAEPFDENAVRTASSGLGAVMADQAVLRAKVRAEVMQILTPEQRAKAAELRTRADQRMQQRRQRLEQRRQPLNQATPKPGA